MASWSPDTCECMLEFSKLPNTKENFIKFIKKCKIHNKVEEVILHNQTFNLKFGNNPTNLHIKEIHNNKSKEKERIKNIK